MFPAACRRRSLLKHLWKLRIRLTSPSTSHLPEAGLWRQACRRILKRLDVHRLQHLLDAIKSRGTADPKGGSCCLLTLAESASALAGQLRDHDGHRPKRVKQVVRFCRLVLPFSSKNHDGHEDDDDSQDEDEDKPIVDVICGPQVLLAWLFRWPDVRSVSELKQLSWCEEQRRHEPEESRGPGDGGVCVNPFHWSRVSTPDTSQSLHKSGDGGEAKRRSSSNPMGAHVLLPGGVDVQKCSCLCDAGSYSFSLSSPCAVSQVISYSTHQYGSLNYDQALETWCQLAYWEENLRVGRLFPVSSSGVDVFAYLPKGNGLCLSSLFQQNAKPSESTTKTRKKIGHGIYLSQECQDDECSGVWLYNRTDHPIFVSSPTLGPPPQCQGPLSNALTVFKVPPSYSIQIFDYRKSVEYEKMRCRVPCCTDGPFDPHSIRISFAKGWGANYSRQCVNSCPCWLEVLLVIPPPSRTSHAHF